MFELQKTVGKNISFYRRKRGLTQQDLAFEVGIELSSIARMEQGKLSPLLKTLEKIALALNMQPYKLLIPSKKR